MKIRLSGSRGLRFVGWIAIASVVLTNGSKRLFAQFPSVEPAPQGDAKTIAPFDISGYWVSVITEDWRWRMFTPPKGDYSSLPLTADGKKAADQWDPARDEASGNQCRAYGAGGIMRQPGRIHITWQDANTMKLEADAGTQTRLFHFANWKAPAGPPQWQGDSAASWDEMGLSRGGLGLIRPTMDVGGHKRGTLKVVTTHMRPGYLRRNGVPYSEDAVLTEYFDVSEESSGTTWLWVTSLLDDPKNLNLPYTTSTHWKKQADASGWDPTPCSAR